MFLRILLGAFLATKTVKLIRKEISFRELKALGVQLKIPYIPGEDVEKYRARLVEARNKE